MLFSFPSTNLSRFIALTPCRAVRPSCTRHVFVCSETSFSVHCYPINVSIFVQLYMECKPVKPLARPRVSRRFSSAGSKQLRRLCFAGVLHIHRVSRRACIRVCALQVKLAQVVLDKRLMGGRRSADFNFAGSWGGRDFLKFWLQVLVLRSFLCECTSLFELCDCQSLPPSLSCPTMYSDLILFCTLLSYLVLCSFVSLLLPCLALS